MPKRYTRGSILADGGFTLTAEQVAAAPASVRNWLSSQVPLAQDLSRAIARDELFLEYQPLVDGRDRRLRGFEALVRWRHPTGWTVPPGTFIPTAELTGQIVELDRWVLRAVCRQIRSWQDAGLNVPRIAINVSALAVAAGDLEADIIQALAGEGLVPGQIGLEITETALMSSTDRCREMLQRLRKIGITIAIDDFGTGHSCLAYLSRFRPDWLKIPVPLVARVLSDDWDRAIVDAIMRLARDVGVGVVAEGVESQEQNVHLLALGCHVMQGYLFARPLRVEAAAEFMRFAAAESGAPIDSREPRRLTAGNRLATEGFLQ